MSFALWLWHPPRESKIRMQGPPLPCQIVPDELRAVVVASPQRVEDKDARAASPPLPKRGFRLGSGFSPEGPAGVAHDGEDPVLRLVDRNEQKVLREKCPRPESISTPA